MNRTIDEELRGGRRVTDELLRREADLATCCLTMVMILATMSNGQRIVAYAMPWDCFGTADEFRLAGATSVTMASVGTDQWDWFKKKRKSRVVRSAIASRAEAAG